MQYVVFIIKRIVLAICMIYTVDLIISSTGIMIPINCISIITVAMLGLPAVVGLVIMQNII